MDANELVNVAYDAISGIDLTAHDRGQIYGVLQMALRTLEAQHEALLDEADNEAAEAKKLLSECENWKAKYYDTDVELAKMRVKRDAFAAELDAVGKRLANAQREIERLTQERDGWKSEAGELGKRIDNLNAENARLHRSLEERMSVRIPGAVQVVKGHMVPVGSEDL